MTDEPEPGADEGDPSDRPSANLYGSHGSATGANALVINFNGASDQLFGMSREDLLVRLILSQENLVGALEDSKKAERLIADQEREIWRLQDQLGKVRGLLPSLVGLFISLGRDRRATQERRSALAVELDLALDGRDDLRAEFERLDRYLDDLDAQQYRVAQALHETRVEEQGVQNLLDVVRMRLQVLVGVKVRPEQPLREMSTAAFALPGRSVDEEDLLAYASRVLAEAYEILTETYELMKELALELYRTVAPEQEEDGRLARVFKLESELDAAHKRLEASQKAIRAQELKHERELSKQEKELAKHRHKQRTAEPARVLREGSSGCLPGLGLFLLGVVIREVSKLAPLSETQQWVFAGLALIFAGLPIASLLKWSRSVESSAQLAVAALGAFCVVAGNFSWLVALAFGLLALTSVVNTKKIGLGFALALVGALVVSAALPGLMWWSWTGFDWLARVL